MSAGSRCRRSALGPDSGSHSRAIYPSEGTPEPRELHVGQWRKPPQDSIDQFRVGKTLVYVVATRAAPDFAATFPLVADDMRGGRGNRPTWIAVSTRAGEAPRLQAVASQTYRAASGERVSMGRGVKLFRSGHEQRPTVRVAAATQLLPFAVVARVYVAADASDADEPDVQDALERARRHAVELGLATSVGDVHVLNLTRLVVLYAASRSPAHLVNAPPAGAPVRLSLAIPAWPHWIAGFNAMEATYHAGDALYGNYSSPEIRQLIAQQIAAQRARADASVPGQAQKRVRERLADRLIRARAQKRRGADSQLREEEPLWAERD